MAIENEFGLSSQQVLKSNIGWWASSGQITADTNAKPVISITNVGQRDSLVEIYFSGAIDNLDLSLGNTSKLELYLNDTVIYQAKVISSGATGQMYANVICFIPARGKVRIDITDAAPTGTRTTIMRGHFVGV